MDRHLPHRQAPAIAAQAGASPEKFDEGLVKTDRAGILVQAICFHVVIEEIEQPRTGDDAAECLLAGRPIELTHLQALNPAAVKAT